MTSVCTSDYLIFVDTNIFLDFYRARNDASMKLLKRIDDLHNCIITSCQVEMEFKKNRQKVILESLNAMKAPQGSTEVPVFLHTAQSVQIISRTKKDLEKRVSDLKKRSLAVLSKPTTVDPVYKIAQRLFTENNTGLNLRQSSKKQYDEVVAKASARYALGYPPRKKEDTSYGDALNWEWIVKCSTETGKHIVIVSRDSDYGTTYNDECFINDWLQQEFRARVSQKRQLILTNKLAKGFELANITVTKDEVKAEQVQIEEVQESNNIARSSLRYLATSIGNIDFTMYTKNLFESLLRQSLENRIDEEE